MNQIVIIGNVGAEPKERQYDVSLSVATTTKWTKDGNENTNTVWHNVLVKGEQRQKALSLKKGQRVCLCGRQKNGSFEGQNGEKKYYNYIECYEVFVALPERKNEAKLPDDFELPVGCEEPDWLK